MGEASRADALADQERETTSELNLSYGHPIVNLVLQSRGHGF